MMMNREKIDFEVKQYFDSVLILNGEALEYEIDKYPIDSRMVIAKIIDEKDFIKFLNILQPKELIESEFRTNMFAPSMDLLINLSTNYYISCSIFYPVVGQWLNSNRAENGYFLQDDLRANWTGPNITRFKTVWAE